jgi:hypothetical protein
MGSLRVTPVQRALHGSFRWDLFDSSVHDCKLQCTSIARPVSKASNDDLRLSFDENKYQKTILTIILAY